MRARVYIAHEFSILHFQFSIKKDISESLGQSSLEFFFVKNGIANRLIFKFSSF